MNYIMMKCSVSTWPVNKLLWTMVREGCRTGQQTVVDSGLEGCGTGQQTVVDSGLEGCGTGQQTVADKTPPDKTPSDKTPSIHNSL